MTSDNTRDSIIAERTSAVELAHEETSLFGFINVLLKYRRMIAVLVVAFGSYGTMKFLQALPKYTTRVGIHVESSTGRPSRSGLVSMLAPGQSSSDEIAFFSELLRSPPLLRAAARSTYVVHTTKGIITGTLAKFYGFEGPAARHEDEMVSILMDHVHSTGSSRTGMLWIFVDAPYPELSQQIAANVVSELDVYSRKRRRARASAEREFLQGRLAESRGDLGVAEQQIVQFYSRNRDISSPPLKMTESGLQRDIQMKQQLYTSLLQSYDVARIAEARNLPSITYLEPPERPQTPDRSSAAALPLLEATVGLLIGIVIAFVRERLAEHAAAPTPAFYYYLQLKRLAMRDLRNPLRSFQRASKARFDE